MTAQTNLAQSSAPASKPFVITRTFDAPRDVVFEAWTGLEGVKNWMGPKGVSLIKATNDLRPGGMLHYLLRTQDGKEMWGKWTYSEIKKPERVIAVVAFTDEGGEKILPHPMAPDWPAESLSLCEFAEKNGKTTVTVTWQPLNPTPAQQRAFDAGHEGMTMGWTGSLDKLDAYLAGITK